MCLFTLCHGFLVYDKTRILRLYDPLIGNYLYYLKKNVGIFLLVNTMDTQLIENVIGFLLVPRPLSWFHQQSLGC